jgi:hypothetical protein
MALSPGWVITRGGASGIELCMTVPAVPKRSRSGARNQSRTQAVPFGMERAFPIRADAGIFVALFVIVLSTIVPLGALYWLMRPTILPNPGITAYQAPRPDPVVPRVARGVEQSRGVEESYALSITAAKRENELLNAEARSAFAAARDAKPPAEAAAPSAKAQQKRQRSARTQQRQSPSLLVHEAATPIHSWALRDQASRPGIADSLHF